jgi:hypothetical protein
MATFERCTGGAYPERSGKFRECVSSIRDALAGPICATGVASGWGCTGLNTGFAHDLADRSCAGPTVWSTTKAAIDI